MQALDNDTASLPGLNGMSRRVLVHRPVLVLDKLRPTWKNATGSEGMPLSPQSHPVANEPTFGQTNTFYEDVPVETSVALPSKQSSSTSVGRKRGRNTKKGGFVKKKRIVAAATIGDHDQTSYCNDTNSEHLSDCTSSTPHLLSPINMPHFSSPSPFTVSPSAVPSSSPPITTVGTVPFSSQPGGVPISSISDTVVGVTVGLSSSSLSTIMAVSSLSSSQTTNTQGTVRTTSFVQGSTTTAQSTDGVSHKTNSGTKFVPSDKPGRHYRYATLSSPPGCARMIPVTYIFLEESLLKRKAEKHKKKTKKLNQVTKSTPIKKEPMSGEDRISDQHPSTQSCFSPNGHTLGVVNIKREPITDDFSFGCLSHSTACDTRDAMIPLPPSCGMSMPLTSSPTLNDVGDQGTAVPHQDEPECRGLSCHDHPHPYPDHSVSTRRKSDIEKKATDTPFSQPLPPSQSIPVVDVHPSGQLHSTSGVSVQPTELAHPGPEEGIQVPLSSPDVAGERIQTSLPSPHVAEEGIQTSLPTPHVAEECIQTSLPSPHVAEEGIQTSLPSPHVAEEGIRTSLPSPHVAEERIQTSLPSPHVAEERIQTSLTLSHVQVGGSQMSQSVSEVCSQPSLLTQHFDDVDIRMPVSKEAPTFSSPVNDSPQHGENQADVDQQLPHSLSLPQEKYSPDPKSVTVEELLSSFNDNNFQLPCSQEATNELDELLNFMPMSSHGDISTSNPTLHVSSVSLPCDTPCGLNLLTPPSETLPIFTSGPSSSSQNPSGVIPTQDLLNMPLLTPMEEAPLPVKEVEVCVERMNLKDVSNGSFNSVMSSSISTKEQVGSSLNTKKGGVEGGQQGRVTPIKILRIRNTSGAVKDVTLTEMEVQDKSTTTKKYSPKKKGSKWKIKNKSKPGPKKQSKVLVIKMDANNQNVGVEEAENRNVGVEEAGNRIVGVDEAENRIVAVEEAGNRNVGVDEAKNRNIGVDEAGNQNVGVDEAGNRNVGVDEAGNRNVGVNEAGNRNVGVDEAKNRNIGVDEAGNQNVGVDEAGNRNVGVDEAGNRNVGVNEAGNRNVGVDEAGNQNVGVDKAENRNVGVEEAEIMLATPKGRESDGEKGGKVQHRPNTPPVLQKSVEADVCHQDSVKGQGEASSKQSTKILSRKGKQKKDKDEDCLLDANAAQIGQSDREERILPPVEPPVRVGTSDELVSFRPQAVSSASNSKEEWPTDSLVVSTSTPLLERGFSFNLEIVKERIASTAVIPTSNVCSEIQNGNNQRPSSPIVFTLEEVIKKQQKDTHQELNHIRNPDEICLDGKSSSSLSTPTFSPPLSNLSSPPCQPLSEAQEDGDLLEIHPFDYQDDDMSLLGEAVQTKHPRSHPGPPTQSRNIPTTPGSSPNLGTPSRPQPLLRSQVSPLFPGIGLSSTRTNVPFHPPHMPHKTLPLPPPHHATEGIKSPLIDVAPLPFLPFSPPSGNTSNLIRSPMYGRNSTVEQRTKEWIEDVKRCPPPPPPPPDINRNVSYDSVDLDDDFVSASIINEPMMTTFSSSPKEENKPYKNWRGHCRFWYSYGKCNHTQQCTLKHGPEDSLPLAVAAHLKNVSTAAMLTGISMVRLSDDIVHTVTALRRDLDARLCANVWGYCMQLEQRGIHLSLGLYEELLKKIAEANPMTEELSVVAKKCFDRLKSSRKCSHPQDFNYLILTCLRAKNLPRACDHMNDMYREGLVPSGDVMSAFVCAMDTVNPTLPGLALIRQAFPLALKFFHYSHTVNLLFKILLKSPQELEREILITIDEAVKLDNHPLKVENLAPVIDICLAHNRSQALGKLLRFCRCIDLLPAESIVSLLKAIAARKLDTSLFGFVVHHAQREQIKSVDSSTWSELLEVLCSLNHMRDIKMGISICSQNSVQINDKTLWKLIHAFLRGPDIHAAVDVFKGLAGMEDYDPSCIPLMCQPLTIQKDWERLLCVCQKMLEMKIPVRCQDLVPLFELLFECNLKQHLVTLVLLVLDCPAAYRHVPLGILMEAEKRLKNHKEGQAAYQRLVDFLKFDVYDSFMSQASFTPTLNSLWGYIQLFMKSDEWDTVALSLKKINPFPLSFGETLFTSLCGRLSRHKSFEKAFALFVETLTRDVVPSVSTAVMQLVGQMGLSLLLQAASDQHWEAGFTTLHQLHRHGVHYIDHTPYDNEASNQFPTKCSRMMGGVLVCVNVSPDAALEVFRGCSWQQPESGCSRDLELVRQYLPDLLTQYMNSSKHDAVQEILTNLGTFLQDEGRNMYQSLFAKYLADKQFDKAYDTCVFLMDKLKFIRKKTLIEFLSVLRSFQPRTAETTGRRKNLLNMAIEMGIFPNIKGNSPLSLSLPEQITKEEAALLVEHYVEDLCLHHTTLGDLYVFFPSKALLHDSMDYILHFFTPHLLWNRIEEDDREPHILVSQSSLEAWRRANMNDSAPCSSGTTQSNSVEMSLESGAVFAAKSGGKGQQKESVVKAWQRAWRSAVQKTLNSLVQPHKKTKFKDRGDRHHFLKHLCSLYCKKIESEHKGPWVLDDSRKANLQSIVEQLMKKITLYDPASTLSLGL